jgi:hypothetical protein
MSVDAAIAGMGIALESTLMMGDALRDGRLVCPVSAPPEIRRATQWLVCPPDRLRHRRVQASEVRRPEQRRPHPDRVAPFKRLSRPRQAADVAAALRKQRRRRLPCWPGPSIDAPQLDQ